MAGLPGLVTFNVNMATYFSGEIDLILAFRPGLLPVAVIRMHNGDLHAVGLGEGP